AERRRQGAGAEDGHQRIDFLLGEIARDLTGVPDWLVERRGRPDLAVEDDGQMPLEAALLGRTIAGCQLIEEVAALGLEDKENGELAALVVAGPGAGEVVAGDLLVAF